MKILIVKLSAIGDVVHTMPLAAALRKRFPAAELSWLVEEAAADILVGYDKIDKLLVSPRQSLIKALKAGKWRKAARLIRAFIALMHAQGEYDIIIDAHGLLKSAALVGLLKAKRKIGYNSLQEGSGLFYTEKIFEDFGKHAVERYLDFAAYLGAPSTDVEFSINIENIDIDSNPLLAEKGFNAHEPFIAISPQALWQTKLWDERKFAELADMIWERLGWQVVLTGKSSKETNQIEKLAKKPLVNIGGITSLRTLAALYQRASLVVSTDSGPMHIAAAVDTPVVAIFGPTNENRTGPYGSTNIVVSADIDCRPCLLKKCGSLICMKAISAEAVFYAIKTILEKKR